MRLRKKDSSLPGVIVIPMIDIMFFLLVFFMLATMHMTNLRAVSVNLSELTGADTVEKVAFAVTVDDKGATYIGDNKVDLKTLQQYAAGEIKKDPSSYIVLRSDRESRYQDFSGVLEALKKAGVSRFYIATESADSKGGTP